MCASRITPPLSENTSFSKGSSRGHLPRESLANWLRSSVGRHRHVGHAGGVCGLGRQGAAPSRVDARSWERDFQRRDAKCVTDSSIRSCMTHRLPYKVMPVTDWSISRARFTRPWHNCGHLSRHLSDLRAQDHGRARCYRPRCEFKCGIAHRLPVVRM